MRVALAIWRSAAHEAKPSFVIEVEMDGSSRAGPSFSTQATAKRRIIWIDINSINKISTTFRRAMPACLPFLLRAMSGVSFNDFQKTYAR